MPCNSLSSLLVQLYFQGSDVMDSSPQWPNSRQTDRLPEWLTGWLDWMTDCLPSRISRPSFPSTIHTSIFPILHRSIHLRAFTHFIYSKSPFVHVPMKPFIIDIGIHEANHNRCWNWWTTVVFKFILRSRLKFIFEVQDGLWRSSSSSWSSGVGGTIYYRNEPIDELSVSP